MNPITENVFFKWAPLTFHFYFARYDQLVNLNVSIIFLNVKDILGIMAVSTKLCLLK